MKNTISYGHYDVGYIPGSHPFESFQCNPLCNNEFLVVSRNEMSTLRLLLLSCVPVKKK